MRATKSLLVMALVVGLVTTMGIKSFAGPLPPHLLPDFPNVWTPGQAVMGQSTLSTFTGNSNIPTQNLQIDWIVMFLGTPLVPWAPEGTPIWAYIYQIENPTPPSPLPPSHPKPFTVSSFSVSTVEGPPFLFATTISGDLDDDENVEPFSNLSIPAHNLVEETELATSGTNWLTQGTPVPLLTGVTWSFGTGDTELPSGYESEILIAYAAFPPKYGNSSANDDVPPSPWSGPVPVPSPEPSTIALIAMGLLIGVTGLRRYSK